MGDLRQAMTVAVSRLQPHRTIPRITDAEFSEVMKLLLAWLPKLPGP
jgi:hypothetical protein